MMKGQYIYSPKYIEIYIYSLISIYLLPSDDDGVLQSGNGGGPQAGYLRELFCSDLLRYCFVQGQILSSRVGINNNKFIKI